MDDVLLPDSDIDTALDLVKQVREKANRENSHLREELQKIANMVHQAYHQDIPGNWETCCRGVCQRVVHTLKHPCPPY